MTTTRLADREIKNPFVRKVAVFPADGHARFGIDRIQLNCYLKSTRRRFVRPRVVDSAWSELTRRKDIERVRGRLVANLTTSFSVSLGGERGGDGSITGLILENILRRLRVRLVREGRYPANAKAPGTRDNNFLDVERITGPFDVHRESLREFARAVDEAREQYQRALMDLFGIDVDLNEIVVSVAEIELCWDVPSPAAQAAATLWWPAWRDANRGAAIGLGRSESPEERLLARRTEATDQREDSAVNGTGVLRADAAKGGGLKLYAKHDRLLRFESELTRTRVSKLIGHRIRVDNAAHLASDLESLGRIAYRRLLAAQANLICERVLSLGELFAAFLPDDDGEKIRALIEAFEAGNKFHHVGRTHERILPRLQRRGLIEYQGRGIWAPRGELHCTFKLLQFMRTRSEGPA